MTRIAVLNQKGGVGKTTVALGLVSAALARGRSVLTVDLDPQASASWALGVDDDGAGATTVAALRAGRKGALADAVVPSSWDASARVVPSGSGLIDWVPEGGPKTRARAVAKALGAVDEATDLTVIDCPPGLGMLTVNALSAADLALIVVEPAAFSNNTVKGVADLIDDVWDRYNPDLDLAGVIVNRVPAVSNEADARYDQLGSIVGRRSVWKPPIPQRVIVNEALGARRPIHSYGRRAADVTEVFDKLLRKLDRAAATT